jgi:ribose transport system permease protein
MSAGVEALPESDDRNAGPDAVAGESRRSTRRTSVLSLLERFGLLILLILAVIVFSILRPDTFATAANWRSIAVSQSVLAVAAMALIVPLIGGRFDVSVGAIIGITSIATASAMSRYNLPLLLATVIGVGFGAFIGIVNGTLVSRLGVNSIICTLGIATVLAGLVSWWTNGVPISSGLSDTLTNLSVRTILEVPALFLVMLVICTATWYLLTQTPYGRHLAAVGSNLTAARLTGVSVTRVVFLSFVTSGTLAGIAGVLQIAALGNGNPQVGGLSFILPALAAVFLGATTWKPGRYNVPGTLLSLFFLGTMVSGLVLLGARPWITSVFNGSAVVVAIVLSAQIRRHRTGSVEIGE